MSHIGDGELHAWLDGALDQLGEGRAAQVREHLRGCAACREALVAEEAVRARAVEVLALAAPRVAEPPPLETLVERARAREDVAPARRMSRVARFGWAASVVIALGAGWMARDLGIRPVAAPAVAERDVAADAATAGPVAGVGAEVGSAAAAVEETQPAVLGDFADASATGNVAGASQGPARAERPEAETMALAAPPPPSPPPSAVVSAQTFAVESRDVQADRLAAVAEPPAISLERAAAPAVAQARADTPAAPPSTGGGAAEAQRREAPRPSERVQMTSALQSAAGVGMQAQARDTVATPREPITGIADEDEVLDISVPGLVVLHAEWSQLTPGQPSRRVLQLLPSGDTLEIRFAMQVPRSVADPLATLVSAAPLPGWNQVVRMHRNGWLVARAPIAVEELEALAARAGETR
jgi:anti-sigma factor RsiW